MLNFLVKIVIKKTHVSNLMHFQNEMAKILLAKKEAPKSVSVTILATSHSSVVTNFFVYGGILLSLIYFPGTVILTLEHIRAHLKDAISARQSSTASEPG